MIAKETTSLTLVEQLVRWACKMIDEQVFLMGTKMPSIRQLAIQKKVSRFTVVEAYERLVALGYLEARKRSGFYVKRNPLLKKDVKETVQSSTLDLSWLLRNTLKTASPDKGPGLGYLPISWLNHGLLRSSLKSVALQNEVSLLGTGTPQGFLPLRQQLVLHLAEREISVNAHQIILLSGVTNGIDLLANTFVRAGDSVVVGDPAWHQMFGRFAAQGAKLIRMPYTPEGIDLAKLEQEILIAKPKLLIINSILQNPTGMSISATQAQALLKLANQYDFFIVEDDVCSDFLMPNHSFKRLASLDTFNRVIYLGSFSKTLSANLRVGFVTCSPDIVEILTQQKMITGLATPELNERILYKILTEGYYRRHIERLRILLSQAREKTVAHCHRLQMRLFHEPEAGMFLWVDTSVDTELLAAKGYASGFLFAPGRLFSCQQQKSTWMRLNVANCLDQKVWNFLSGYLEKH